MTNLCYSTGNWVVGWNGSVYCGSGADGSTCYEGAGWAYSSDLNGSSWTANEALDFGAPTGADGGVVIMSDGYPFAGLSVDPGLAPVLTTPADAGDYNKRILYTMMADSQGTLSTKLPADVAIAISDNGGQTFGHAKLVTDPTTAAGGIDHPAIATHKAPPYSTWVTWTQAGAPAKLWIRQVSYSDDANFTFTAGPAIQVPTQASGDPRQPFVDVGVIPYCALGVLDEAVYVSWVVGAPDRCDSSGSVAPNISWWFAVYDTGFGTWSGPWEIDSDTNWPGCIGSAGSTGGVTGLTTVASNSPAVRIAAHYDDPSFDAVWVKTGSGYGTRVAWNEFTYHCYGNNPNPDPGPGWTAPDPCLGGCFTHCCDTTDAGSPIVTDEWGPVIAYVKNTSTGTDETLWTWYDTRQDPSNTLVTIYGEYFDGTTFTGPVQIGTGQTGETVPWNYTLGYWWDYQALQPDLSSFRFLGSWGGDNREAPPDGGASYFGSGGIESAVIQ